LSQLCGRSRSLGCLLLIQPALACSPTQFAIKTKFRALKPEGRLMPQSLTSWMMISLAGYIPTYGDRITARRFCLENQGPTAKESEKKHSLLEKLKKKMGIDVNDDTKSDHAETSAPKQKRSYTKNNKWAEKKTRKVGVDSQSDENVTVGELYMVLRMGVLKFDLCTQSMTDEDNDDEEKSDVSNDVQLRDPHEEDEQVTQTVFEPMANQLDDTLIHQPILQFEEHDLVIASITLLSTNTALITPDTAAIGDEASSSTAPHDVVCATIKLHRVNLLEGMISQFKDQALLKHRLKYYIHEKGANADGI
ncbi:uncharacterized protein LOC125891993 isoform X1, partial [Scomber scombrus]